jgi:hypothetical protein
MVYELSLQILFLTIFIYVFKNTSAQGHFFCESPFICNLYKYIQQMV